MKDIAEFIALADKLGPDTLDAFVACYAQDCMFTDPFQTVHGRKEVRRVYLDMLTHLHAPRFCNVRLLGAADPGHRPMAARAQEIVIGWDFEFAISPGKPRTLIAGASALKLNDRGEIIEHRDYWDASRLMQAFPVIGPAIGWLRRKIGQPH